MNGAQAKPEKDAQSRYLAADSTNVEEDPLDNAIPLETLVQNWSDDPRPATQQDIAGNSACCASSWCNPNGRRHRPKECNTCFALAVAYFSATVFFLGGVNFDCLPYLPHPLLGNLLPQRFQVFNEVPVVVFILLWGIHFIRRFAEVLFLHDLKRRYTCLQGTGTCLYLIIFGLWIGWSVNFLLGGDIHKIYKPPPYSLTAFGVLIFIIGEAGNLASYITLHKLRHHPERVWTSRNNHHVLPNGFLFKYVSCPQHLFEIFTWLGFAVATCTMSSVVFFTINSVMLVFYARRRHMEYVRDFDGMDGRPDYKKLKRKVVFPGIY